MPYVSYVFQNKTPYFFQIINLIKRPFFFLMVCFIFACQKNDGPRILNRTCVTTQHHDLIIGNIEVYVKYDATDFNFPGWEDLAEYDTVFSTNSAGMGCIENLRTGKHWLVGLGFDEAINLPIKGRTFVEITFEEPELDLILYVGEE